MGTPPVVQQSHFSNTHLSASTHKNGVLTKATPPISTGEASHLASTVFGVDGAATLLTGERDQNFLIQGLDNQKFVLKVTHPSEEPGVTDFQTKAQLHMLRHNAEVPVPKMYPTTSGDYIHWKPVPDTGERQAVRLISFVEGVPLFKTTTSKSQRSALGTALAKFDVAIADFTHPQMDHKLMWDLLHVAELEDLLVFIDE